MSTLIVNTINDISSSGATVLNGTATNSVGYTQTWQSVIGSRTGNSTSYQNTTGKPIMVAISENFGGNPQYQVSSDNVNWVAVGLTGSNSDHSFSFIVPNNHYYRWTATNPTPALQKMQLESILRLSRMQ
jgi:hypothetical protein